MPAYVVLDLVVLPKFNDISFFIITVKPLIFQLIEPIR
jgi:hypothetical protein